MGTSACTRISANNDYIELHTRWDGFHKEISDDVNNLLTEWKAAFNFLKESIQKNNQGTFGLTEWISNLEQLINDYESNKTIENLTVLLSSRSFSHHQVLLHKADYIDFKGNKANGLNYQGKDNPTMTFNIENGKVDSKVHEIHFDYTLNEEVDAAPLIPIQLTPKSIDPIYKVARISKVMENGEFDPNYYLDVKFKDMTDEKLAFLVMRLPQFFRDVYTVTKEVYEDTDAYYDKSFKPIYRLGQKFSYYYDITKKYNSEPSSKKAKNCSTQKNRTSEERAKSKEDLLNMINRIIPLDFGVSAMATHLFITGVGQILPVTEAEKLSDYPISVNIGVLDSRLAHVVVNIPGKNEGEMTELLDKCTNSIAIHEVDFNKHHNLDIKLELGEYFKGIPGLSHPFIGIPYEKNLIHFFDSQHDIEIQ